MTIVAIIIVIIFIRADLQIILSANLRSHEGEDVLTPSTSSSGTTAAATPNPCFSNIVHVVLSVIKSEPCSTSLSHVTTPTTASTTAVMILTARRRHDES
jgi:hypothetical protein